MGRTKATQMPLPNIEGPETPPLPRRGRRAKGDARLNQVGLTEANGQMAEQPATLSKLLHSTARTENLLRYIAPNTIDPNPHQPRRSIDEPSLQQLVESVHERGILQPILVARGPSGRYILVAGQRRLEAARRLALARVPAMIVDKFDSASVVDSLIENIQRVSLSDMDTGETFRLLQEEYNWTQEEIARRIGKDQSYVSNHISVARNLTPLTKQLIAEAASGDEMVEDENMTRVIFSHTVNRKLARLAGELQEAAARQLIIMQPATTRQAEAIIKRVCNKAGGDISVSPSGQQHRKWQVDIRTLQTTDLLRDERTDGEALMRALEADLAALREQWTLAREDGSPVEGARGK